MAVTRRTLLSGSVGLVVGTGLTSCAGTPAADRSVRLTGSAPTLALGAGGPDAAARLATSLWDRAGVAVVLRAGADATAARDAATAARALRVPLLVEGPELADTVRRLGTQRVLAYPEDAGLVLSGVTVTTGASDDLVRSPLLTAALGPPLPPIQALSPPDADPAAVVLAESVGAHRVGTSTDPRSEPATIAALRAEPGAGVVLLGEVDEGRLARRVRTARRAPELPIAGGGQLPLEGRLLVALYGHPQTRSLGLLGEQGISASVRRAEQLAVDYRGLTPLTVVPAFELIATVASGSAGPRGEYSQRTPLAVLRPWVEAARSAGVYCVLDLQSGRADSLTQAQAYEELLLEPHVGLALDPEWRLEPGGRPLQRIGHLDVEEVNRVGRWLDDLVTGHDLPPKVLTLHQFQTQMIRDRDRLDTSLDNVQWVVHADGQGGQPAKQATWARIRESLPPGVHLGWKNFVDEDRPMLTPEQTWARVAPHPSLISYQ